MSHTGARRKPWFASTRAVRSAKRVAPRPGWPKCRPSTTPTAAKLPSSPPSWQRTSSPRHRRRNPAARRSRSAARGVEIIVDRSRPGHGRHRPAAWKTAIPPAEQREPGFGAVRRLSTEFDIFSTRPAGTVIMSRVARPIEPAKTNPMERCPHRGAGRDAVRRQLQRRGTKTDFLAGGRGWTGPWAAGRQGGRRGNCGIRREPVSSLAGFSTRQTAHAFDARSGGGDRAGQPPEPHDQIRRRWQHRRIVDNGC